MVWLALVGATLIFVRGTVFARLRRVYPPLFGCAQCAGFWVGALAGLSGVARVAPELGARGAWGGALGALLAGCAASLLSLLADAVLLDLLGDPEE